MKGLCELDLASCREMKRRGIPIHGKNYRYRQVYYLGEGYDCSIHKRRLAEGWIPRDIRDPLDDETSSELAPTADYYDFDIASQYSEKNV
ncbi:unnamed protein product [Danaus chrysippus]|uniref:(African queen) hypothetical protein n=1 Tax=Danaus chrysippus TaxID=151541 RepID=A0A8J2R1P3_9NEOP|nr:unnamed protein product [Danaus chrysippus]